MTRLTDLVKTVKLLNDPKAPEWNVKFAGAIFAVLLAAVAVVAIAALPLAGEPAPPPTSVASEADAGPATKTDYVGLDPTSVTPGAVDATAVEAAVDRWYVEHPEARVLEVEPVFVGNQVVGYHIAYEE